MRKYPKYVIYCNLFPLNSNLYYVDKEENVSFVFCLQKRKVLISVSSILTFNFNNFSCYRAFVMTLSLAVFDLNMVMLFLTIPDDNENVL